MRRCERCGCREYGGAPACPRCLSLLDALVETGWTHFLDTEGLTTALGHRPSTAVSPAAVREGRRGAAGPPSIEKYAGPPEMRDGQPTGMGEGPRGADSRPRTRVEPQAGLEPRAGVEP